MLKYFYSRPTSPWIPMPIPTQVVKQKAKRAGIEGDQNASITTQLVKQKAKWAVKTVTIMLASQNVKKKQTKAMREPKATKSYKEPEQHQDQDGTDQSSESSHCLHKTEAFSRLVLRIVQTQLPRIVFAPR